MELGESEWHLARALIVVGVVRPGLTRSCRLVYSRQNRRSRAR